VNLASQHVNLASEPKHGEDQRAKKEKRVGQLLGYERSSSGAKFAYI
jgi:hypothetical protein